MRTERAVRVWPGWFEELFASLAGVVGRVDRRRLAMAYLQRAQLTQWARRAKTAQYLAVRARIVLRCAEGGTNKQTAAELGIDTSAVVRWRGRFIAGRLEGLAGEPRPGRPPRSSPARSRR